MAALAALTLLIAAAPAQAIVISNGPTTAPGGGWTCTAPAAGTEKLGSGGNYSCSGTAGAFSNLYIGINRNTTVPFGEKMNSAAGSEPTGAERFVWSADGANFIRYTGQTTISTYGTVFTRVTLTFSGSGSVVDDATTQALTGANINGSVHSLWRIAPTVSSMAINVLIEASDSASGPFIPADTFFGTPSAHRRGTGSTDQDKSHVDVAFYTSSCGDTQVDTNFSAEECDLGGANGSSTSCCTSACQFRTGGQVCRVQNGLCDVADTCTGIGATCPSDGFASSSTPCRSAAGVCDQQENCTGSSPTCPADGKKTTQCRGPADLCDAPESCDGVGNDCPADQVQPATFVCRNAVSPCDVADQCDGVSMGCTADVVATAGIECRAVAGDCDVAESCDGSSNTCPTDTFVPATQECRASAGDCDVAENCTGTSATCPTDGFQPNTLECRGSVGDCDSADNCTGSSATCPADGKSTAVCRPAGDACDVAEQCDGVSNDCPADGFLPASVECRASAGDCDVAESCTGSGSACPADAFAPSTQGCRVGIDDCDAPESCTGSTATCPPDMPYPSGTVCRGASDLCDVAESCDGSSNACPADQLKPSSEVCRPSIDSVCDVAESCTGSSAACPTDVHTPDGTSCNDSQTCTLDDQCISGSCVGDSMLCGNGMIESGCGEECDDGNTSSLDGCSATCQTEFSCMSSPTAGCRRPFVPGKASFQVKDKTPDTGDSLQWKWLKGRRTTVADFGNPVTTTDYLLCVYDAGVLKTEAVIPADGTCAGKPCWKATGKGFKYKDKDATPDGIAQLLLKEGSDGKAKIIAKGKGPNIPMPALPMTQPVVVQLRNSSNSVCWEAVYSAPATKNDPTFFKDKAD